jgi:hypothetical protein
MADPTLKTPQRPTRAGIAPTWITPTATYGDAITYSPGLILLIKNLDGGSDAGTITLTTNATELGDAVSDHVYTVAAGAELMVSDFSPIWDLQASGASEHRIIIIPGGAAVADLRYCAIAI